MPSAHCHASGKEFHCHVNEPDNYSAISVEAIKVARACTGINKFIGNSRNRPLTPG